MKNRLFSIYLVFIGVASANLANQAFAQTPVSTSVNISGSCVQCDLSHRVMPRISLQGSDFSGSDFSHSNLSGGKFYRSNLSGASFYKAYLLKIEGDGVILSKAILRDATLTSAVLTTSNISRADLRRADLTGGDFSGTDFSYSNLKSVDAMNTVFKNANFTGAKLKHGTFTGADFTHANLTDTDFGNAVLDNAAFINATLTNAKLAEATGLTQEQFLGACGDERTELPDALNVPHCSVAPIMTVATARPDAPAPASDISDQLKMVQIPTIFDQNLESGIRILFSQPIPSYTRQTPKQEALREAITGIDAAMRDLPVDSPTRSRLSKSREILETLHQAEE